MTMDDREQGLGFLQLCSDRRFHRRIMESFEQASGLAPDEYWLEIVVGGAPGQGARTMAAEFARSKGARHMGWAAHGDECGGFPDTSNEQMREMLERTVERRRRDYQDATHYVFFATLGGVDRLA
jgi:hypothetical protein